MAIMVAGGLTFAVPSTMPAAYAEVTTSNPHLYVSAEGQDADNQFAQGNIIEVIIRDDSIGDTDEGEAEPTVTINGADLRMLQTGSGDWRAYFAQTDAIAAIDTMGGELDYGEYCNKNVASETSTLVLTDSNGVYFPPGSVDSNCEITGSSSEPNHPLIRQTQPLTDHTPSGDTLGQLGLENRTLWPFIQVFDFAPESKVNIVYQKSGTPETVTLEFDDPSESHSLDRTKYPQGAHVLVTIEDYALNIDPTDEDTWAFDTNSLGGLGAYYNLFNEDGEPKNVNKRSVTNYAGEAGIGEQLKIERSGQGGDPLINCQVTGDFGINNVSNANTDHLMVNKTDPMKGACVPNTISNPTDEKGNPIFTEENFVIGFVEDGSNNNKFINWADDQESNLVVRGDAQRNRSFEIDYNDPGAISGVVGHFFAELTLGDAGATWNSGERISITVTDEDVNTNPLKENDLTVKNPDSKLIPSIKIGSPITLASASGNVVWYDLENDPVAVAPAPRDTTPPTITVTGGAFMVSNTITTAASVYTDEGATCTDDDGTDRPVTTTITRESTGTTTTEVDLNDPDTYTLTYSCADAEGNPATSMTRTVTVTSDPVINLTGLETVKIGQDADYKDRGATCMDDVDGSIALITRNATSIDTSKLGEQTIVYSCTDRAGNTGTATRTVIVEDKDLPVININDPNPAMVNQTLTYTDAGATCADGDDGSNIPNITDNSSAIETSMVGSQVVMYTCTDLEGNVNNATRTVKVVDVTDPELVVDPIMDEVSVGSNLSYDYMAGVTCTDNADTDPAITNNGTVVDRTKSDTYFIMYTCTDDAGLTNSTIRTVTVSDDTTPPTIELKEPNRVPEISLNAMNDYVDDLGATCTDNLDADEDITGNVDAVDKTKIGTYQVTYDCSDEAENPATTVTRDVKVVLDGNDPEVVFDDAVFMDSVPEDLLNYDPETGVTCVDDVEATLHVSNPADVSTPDDYQVVYTCIDTNNNSDAEVRTVTVTSTAPTAPGAPTGLTATPGDTEVTLSWTAPADGGSAITGYVIEYDDGTNGWQEFARTTTTATTIAVTGLVNTVSHDFRVSAMNAVGTGDESDEASATPTAVTMAPGAPTGLTATPGDTEVTLSWTAPADGGSAITGYVIEYDDGTNGWQEFARTTTTATTIAVTGLVNTVSHDFRVSAMNAVGTGDESDEASATPTAVTMAPGAPTGLTATPGDTEVTLSWTAPADGGSAITGYVIEYDDGTNGWQEFARTTTTATTIAVTGLVNTVSHDFRVSAMNAVGTGDESDEASATPTAVTMAPGAPTGLTATPGDTEVTLSWTAPADGGSAITGYVIEYDDGTNGWQEFARTTTTATTIAVTGLVNTVSHDFRVSAMNAVGTGDESDEASATPTAAPTSTPLPFTATPSDKLSFTIDENSIGWTADNEQQLLRVDITVTSDSDVSNVFLLGYTSTDADYSSFTTSSVSSVDDGLNEISKSTSNPVNNMAFDNDAVSNGDTIWLVLEGDNSDGVRVYSTAVSITVSGLSGTSVDMTTTPVSYNTAGFPPITRAVINDVSAIPAVHQVQQPSNTYPMEKYTWSVNNPRDINDCDDLSTFTDKYCVEKFSDRLRLSHDSNDMTSISGNSKIVVYDWDAPTFDDGVTTLFNWNFDSISHADVINVTLAQYGDHSNNQLIANGSSGLEDITSMKSNIEALGDKVDLVIMLKDTDYGHICDDITLVADFFTFGQTPEGDRVNNAIYRIEVEEVTPDNSDFAGTLEYVMLNQLNYDDSATYTGLRTIDVDASIIVHEDFTDEDSVRINYFDLGADGVATQIAVQQEAPTHSGVVSFDADNYKIADTVTITVEDVDLNVNNDVVDIYTFSPPIADADFVDRDGMYMPAIVDTIGDDRDHILDVTFDDETWQTVASCWDKTNDRNIPVDGFNTFTGFTLMETASGSGVFTGDFQIPEVYCKKHNGANSTSYGTVESVTGVDIEVHYQDFRDASGEEIEVGAGAAIRANTGTVSLDRTVYPVPFDPAKYGTATDNSLAHNDYEDYNISGDLGVHIRVNDPDFDVSASGQDKIVNASEYLTVMIIRGADTKPIFLNDTDTVGDLNRDGVKEILEVAPDAGVFELDLTIAHNSGPAQGCPTELRGGCILQGDIIQVEYRDETDASGEENTITDSATFDLRNAVLQSDKSVYLIGSDMILTLIEPDFDLDNDGAETYPLDLIEWDSDADTVAMGSDDRFDPEPNGLRETGDSTGIFQSIIEIPAVLGTNDRLERGEEIELEYVDYGPSGSDYIGDETEDINLTVATSNFGATVELDQKVYSWTDKVYITIVAPDHNFDSASVDEIGDSNLDPIKIATRSADIDNYKLVETGPDTGIFTGEVILIGYDHNADGDTSTGTESTGYDNPQRETYGTGPTNGFIETDDEGGITVSFEFSEDETVVGSALIRWNIGEVQWLEASYPATGTGVVRVIDPDMNLNPESVDNFEVDIWSDKDAGGIDLTVTETNQATGIFEGTVFFTVADESSGHRLRVAEGNTVTAEYDDNTLPDPYTTADELGVTATTLIGSIVPPLERVPASNLRIVDAFENSLDSVSVDQQVQIVADITNAQERSQEFAYLVQVQDENGVTVSLAWISGTLEAGQSLSPSSSWIPTDAGEYTATAFVWESVDNPTALSPPVTTTITVS